MPLDCGGLQKSQSASSAVSCAGQLLAKSVADSADGLDELGRELGAQLQDVGVDGARRRKRLEAPDLVEQLFAGEDLAGALDEELEEVELHLREGDFVAFEGAGARGEVERDAAGAERLRLWL